jgi:hypothetical protein
MFERVSESRYLVGSNKKMAEISFRSNFAWFVWPFDWLFSHALWNVVFVCCCDACSSFLWLSYARKVAEIECNVQSIERQS